MGKRVFAETCGKCHEMFGEGEKVGPDLTSTQRYNLDYLLRNVVAPSLEVPEAYKTEVFMTIAGEMITGVVTREDPEKVVVVIEDGSKKEILIDDIEGRKQSRLSVMPAGQFDSIPRAELLDLMKYLQLPRALDDSNPAFMSE